MADGKGNGDPENPRRLWAGVVLLLLASALAVVIYRNDETAMVVGSVFGVLVIALVITFVIRLIWARGKGDKAFELSGFTLCAGVTALIASFLLLAGDAEENRETVDQALDAISTGAQTCPELRLGDLGGGFEAAEPTAAETRQFGLDQDTMAASAGEFSAAVGSVRSYVIRSGDRPFAIVATVPFDLGELPSDQSRDEAIVGMKQGMRDAALEQGATDLEEVTIAGLDGHSYATPYGDYVAATVVDCQMVMTRARDAASATALAERLIEAQPAV